MRRPRLLPRLLSMLAFCALAQPAQRSAAQTNAHLEALGIDVSAEEDRAFSYTDKRNAYFYGKTHTEGFSDYFAGWNVATLRVFQDYQLWVDGQPLQRADARVTVYPHQLVRRFPGATETFSLFDDVPFLHVRVEGLKPGTRLGLSLRGEQISVDAPGAGALFYDVAGAPEDAALAVAPLTSTAFDVEEHEGATVVTTDAAAGGFFIVFAPSPTEVEALLRWARADHQAWITAREARMASLVGYTNAFAADDPDLARALQWNMLTLDQLVTEQTGQGIYAGLPWFNDYWGRDIFISLPGATLVTGEFDVARSILTSFAGYQNTDEDSLHYGRVPNRLRPDDVIYNTTDGTPRFVGALLDYVRYTGDTTLVRTLYPAVRRATEGPLSHWVDDDGFLTHDDADTWMDAKEDGKRPFSPRGNRANDIQALWHRQLRTAAYFAHLMGEGDDARRWSLVADRLEESFRRDFFDAAHAPLMADRLLADGTPDFTVRPNQLFAADLVVGAEDRARLARAVWERLVYPWGVASLWQEEEGFHPYHENWDCYHKDAAYHNGTVWVWNNGIAMQRLLEAGQVEPAYALFRNMTRQTLDGGAVGSLSENMDALPRPGETWPRRSGTFLQAWSNAEYLRVWYQYFLGLQPDAPNNALTLAPRIPEVLDSLSYRAQLLGGTVIGTFTRTSAGEAVYTYRFRNVRADVAFDLPGYTPVTVAVVPGEAVTFTHRNGALGIAINDAEGKPRSAYTVRPDPDETARQQALDDIFQGISFASPHLRPDLKALQACK